MLYKFHINLKGDHSSWHEETGFKNSMNGEETTSFSGKLLAVALYPDMEEEA